MFRNPGLLYVCMIASIMMICCIGCNKQLARSVPTNYILLGIFTFMQSYMVAAVCASIQSPLIVYEAFAITGGIFIAMTIYAILSKEDFTLCGGMLLGAFMALIISGLFLGFSNSSAVQLVYASIAALVFCFSILQSTQLIVG
jgi:FtsH-binding integral membrane protein